MSCKFIILNLFLLVFSTGMAFSQAKPVFSGDPAKFKDELMTYMGTELSEEQSTILNHLFQNGTVLHSARKT